MDTLATKKRNVGVALLGVGPVSNINVLENVCFGISGCTQRYNGNPTHWIAVVVRDGLSVPEA